MKKMIEKEIGYWGLSDFDNDIDTIIENFNNLKEQHPDCTKIRFQPSYDWDGVDGFNIFGARPETEEEENKRLEKLRKKMLKEKERRERQKAKTELAERELFEKLRAKYE